MSEVAPDRTVPHADERSVRRPLRPSRDPFYDEPPGIDALAPGAVVRTRQVDLAFLGLVTQRGLASWQVAYRSTDLHGRAEVAVTTVILPRSHDPERHQRLVAYQCAIDAVSDRCFPSYALRAGARAWGALPQVELTLVASLLEQGHVVTLADHEGRLGQFAAPREPGFRVLDGIRAAIALPVTRMTPQTPVGLIGYSGGGMASSWAAEVAPDYAPELRLVGAVLGSPVGDPGQAFIKLNGGLTAGLPALVVSGLRDAYPGLAEVVRRHTHADGIRRLDRLREMTTVEAVVRYAFDDFDDFVDPPLADVLAEPEVVEVFDDLRLGRTAPRCPVLVVQSVHDQIIDVADVDDLVTRYVDAGAEVSYVRDRLSRHISLMIMAWPAMSTWLEERFRDDERPVATGTRTVTTVALSPRAWPRYLRTALAAVKTAVGRAG